jgi:hypothetical protein
VRSENGSVGACRVLLDKRGPERFDYNLYGGAMELPMTQLMEKAVAELRNLPATEQDAMATLILEELEDERRWEQAFSQSQDELAQLAAKVRQHIEKGNIVDKGIDEL